MRRKRRRSAARILRSILLILISAIIVTVLVLLTSVFFPEILPELEENKDPHEGQVLINDGFNDVWITPYEDVEVNELTEEDFDKTDGELSYTGEDFDTLYGIDVSEHQRYVDWQQVADSGKEFVFVRAGYRGSTQGGLYKDPWFITNVDGARKAGLEVGVYFWSQAVNVREAIEEARYVLELIDGYDITLPVMYDWEKIESMPESRTIETDPSIVGECGVAFCETIKNAGYDAGIYFNRQLGYYGLDLSRLKDFVFWVADPGDYPKFYYAGSVWQYSDKGSVPGIDGDVDLNMMFIKRPEPTPEPDASPAP